MPDDLKARVDALTKAAEDELELLWVDLSDAIDREPAGWSRACYALVERIKDFTLLVGPTSWDVVPPGVLESGLYQRVHTGLGVHAPVDMDELAAARHAADQQHEGEP